MVSIPEVFTDNSPMSPTQSVPVKILAQENHSVSFQKHWASNLIMMSAGYVLVNQTKSQPDLELCCFTVHQIGGTFKKPKGKKAFYNWILQHPKIVQYPIANYFLTLLIEGK